MNQYVKTVVRSLLIVGYLYILSACGAKEFGPSGNISKVLVLNEQVTFDVQLSDDEEYYTTGLSVIVMDSEDNILIEFTPQDGIDFGFNEDIFVIGLEKETTYKIMIIADFNNSYNTYEDVILDEFEFTTGTWDYSPSAEILNVVNENEELTFDVQLTENTNSIITGLSVILVDSSDNILVEFTPEDGIDYGLNHDLYVLGLEKAETYTIYVVADYEDNLYYFEDMILDEFEFTTGTWDSVNPIFDNLLTNRTIEYGESLNLLGLGLTAHDNVDGDITNMITVNIQSTEYLDLGFHNVIYFVSDSSGNTAVFEFILEVIDIIPAEIDLISDILYFQVGSTEPNWIDYFSIFDNYHGLVEMSESYIDTSQVDMDTIGIFPVRVFYEDFSGNFSEFSVRIEITDIWTPSEFFTYDTVGDGIKITGYLDVGPKDVVIPETINGMIVTEIGYHAFDNMQITSVTIPSSVKSIESGAFINNLLTKIHIPHTLTIIGSSIFYNNQLEEIILHDDIVSIDSNAFGRNSISLLILPENLVNIGSGAFMYNHISELLLPDGVESIGQGAFEYNNITSLVLNKDLVQLAGGSFDFNDIISLVVDERNDHLKLEGDLVMSTDGKVVYAMIGVCSTLVIPEGVEIIELSAFSDKGILEIVFPSTIKRIGQAAFYHNSITQIIIPDGVVEIGGAAFIHNNLDFIEISSTVTVIGKDAFSSNGFDGTESIIINGEETRFNEIWEYIGFPMELKPSNE